MKCPILLNINIINILNNQLQLHILDNNIINETENEKILKLNIQYKLYLNSTKFTS